jgi:hypothetical protein
VGEAATRKDEEVRRLEERGRGPRRRISWIWASIWISGLPSSLPVVVRVGFSFPGLEGIGGMGVLLANGEIVTGTLKGYDALMNLVLDDVSEVLRGMYIP